jgi:hypothetical protein
MSDENTPPPPSDKQRGRIQIQLDESVSQGVYANMSLVNHTETEFVLDFVFIQPMEPRAKVRARVISSPRHAKRFLAALQENVTRYEARFGAITVTEPDPNVGPVH